MPLKAFSILTIVLLFFATGCQEAPKTAAKTVKTEVTKDTVSQDIIDTTATETTKTKSEEDVKEDFKLTEDNAIDFFFNYAKTLKEDKVRIKTKYGNIDIQFYKNTPYHWANFIYLTRKHYFDSTYFHRVVPNFIIQGGNTDMYKTQKKRNKIGHYLLPPDTRKGHKHHRGVVSMPSSEIDNPHKLASPFEFFIVAQKPGAYHLDGDYTAFGHVIDGMDVVDTISQLATDAREWPHKNVMMTVEILKD
ncbi:Peptidyl-prolyl cis-trans isomerase (rotamase)-cyclophilin family [Pustulibacterium marinum]|uniref:Peptidyl-prolyl cis-trans isomerase n=1 Tax=Pustulibacterium marinum TaxID=1224947 RepID=A0A1I7H427_9FLAO|nr:peptidylprolyl isomerase [Pustulibacterium marinum]SFU55423.1 Peptidyl-prolyl cis-trans isomerase (rotamase)-cyclophilin family [Pustulibacterium marinum]